MGGPCCSYCYKTFCLIAEYVPGCLPPAPEVEPEAVETVDPEVGPADADVEVVDP